MDGGAWWAAVHGVTKSRTRLSNFTFTFHFQALEKEMATHSTVLAWRIPETGEPDGLLSMGSHRVGHNCSNLAAAAPPYFWMRKLRLRMAKYLAQFLMLNNCLCQDLNPVESHFFFFLAELDLS